jgi:hypothetical protein
MTRRPCTRFGLLEHWLDQIADEIRARPVEYFLRRINDGAFSGGDALEERRSLRECILIKFRANDIGEPPDFLRIIGLRAPPSPVSA